MRTKIRLLVLTLLLSCSVFTTTQAAEKEMTREQTEARVTQIRERVNEIRSMDLSSLNTTQRKEIRSELKDMRKELKQADPTYIYISLGAVIIIILLILILL